MTTTEKVKKNWWPLGIAISSAFTLILFQNCASVKIDTTNPALTVENRAPSDTNDNPAQFPENGSEKTN
jgi:hypothetical protein